MGIFEMGSSYEDYLDIVATTPKNERYELIFGKIYMMSGPSREHQEIVGNIFFQLKVLAQEGQCRPILSPYDIKIFCAGQTHVVQPDISLFCDEQKRPCAIFEVLSPSRAYKEKRIKKELYESCGWRSISSSTRYSGRSTASSWRVEGSATTPAMAETTPCL